MIGLNGEKMSKSKGNLVFVSRLRADRVDLMAVRLALLADHYRTDRQWTDDLRKAGEGRLAHWRAAAAAPAGPPGAPVLAAVRERLAADLDTAGALRAVDSWSVSAGRSAGIRYSSVSAVTGPGQVATATSIGRRRSS